MNVIVLPTEDRECRDKTLASQAGDLISFTNWRLKMNKNTQKLAAPKNTYRILLAEDDREMRALLVFALRKTGYEVIECCDGVGLLTYIEPFLLPNKIEHNDLDLIISDIRMPGFTGMEVLEGMQRDKRFPPMILITAFGDRKTHAMAEEFGAAAMFDKPFDIDDLLDKVRELLPPNEKSGG